MHILFQIFVAFIYFTLICHVKKFKTLIYDLYGNVICQWKSSSHAQTNTSLYYSNHE